MNRAILALFMTFALVNAFTYKGNGFTSDDLFEFVDTTCNGAISGFNKGIQKLISNIQTKSNEWLVYSDLDTLDGYAYHLQNLCDPEDYELTTQLQGGQTPEQQQACSNLLALLGSILDQNQPQAFKSGYEQGLALSNQALTFGPNIVKGCKISIVVDAEAQDDEDESSAEEENGEEEELGLNGENGEEAGVSDDSDAPVILAAKLNLLAEKEAEEDSSDDSSDESNEEEWTGEEWNNDDPLAITKAWDIGQVADKIAKIAKKIAQIAENNEEGDVSDDSDALDAIFAANLKVFAQKKAGEDSSDDSSDESDEEEWAGEEWNNEDPLAITKAWDIGQVADKVAKIAKKIAEIAENNEEAGVSDDSDALDFLTANLNLLAQKEADEDSSDDSSDDNEEEWAGEEWNNEDSLATTKAWNIGTVADKIAKIAKKIAEIAENNEEETLAITKAWDSEKVADKIAKIAKKIAKLAENNEEDALTGWDKGDWSDFSHFGSNDEQYDLSDAPKSTFFYEINPNGNTDSGSQWLNGDYNRYIPGGSGTGNTGTPSIPSIPGIGGNGGSKANFLAAIGQQASSNPWTSGDYKRYYSGDSGNGGAPAKFLAFKQDNAPEDFYWTI